jgi:hypothetical protein
MATYIRLTHYKNSDEKQRIDTMVHLGARAFEEIGREVVQSVVFILEKNK